LQVTKYAGGLRKGFAVTGGILITAFLQHHVYAVDIPNTTWVLQDSHLVI